MTVNKRLGDASETIATPRLRLIAYGAFARELLAIIHQLPPDVAELACLPAAWHNYSKKIVPGIKSMIKAVLKAGLTPVVIYGDCGAGVELDAFLDEENIARIPSPHCYQSSMVEADFDAAMDQELGTFFLTNYMVGRFERIVMKGIGLRDHPHLRDIYFAHSKRVLYIVQTHDNTLVEKARQAAATLQLDYDYHYTGYGDYTAILDNLCRRRQASVAAS